MLKRILTIALASVMVTGLLSGCGTKNSTSSASNSSTTTSTETDKPVTIKMFTNAPEYTDAYNAYIAEYKKVKPNVTIELQVMQADYPTVLKTKIASGDIPDVFQTTAGGEIKQYSEYSADLTNEPLSKAMNDSVRTSMSLDGKVLGFPIKSDLFALIYNKDLFATAGITQVPKTMAELEAVCAKLQAKGITPFANGYKEWWVEKHIFQHFVDASSDNAEKLVGDFIAGKTTFKDHPILLKYFDFIDLTVKNGTAKPLEKDFAAETSDFATGKAAMMTGQGAWAEDGILKITPNFKIGIMGYPINDDPSKSVIIAGSGQALRINKDSKVLKETKELFNWLYTSDYGKKWFSDIAKVIPPITTGSFPNMQMPNAMQEILKTEKLGDESVNYSLDSFHQKFGEIMQAYIGKAKTKDQAIDEIQKAWIQLGAAK